MMMRDSRLVMSLENGVFEGEGGYLMRGEKGYWNRR